MSTRKDDNRFYYKTPDKKISQIQQPVAPYKKKLRKYARTKKIKDDKVSDLMLFDSSKKHFYRYSVFIDQQIGIDSQSQQILMRSEMDEDCQSSDQIISDGLNKALNALKTAILMTKKK